ncbi:hypothetical protein PV729_19520 [Streptomyces europaeiscabiei]|uniref:Uncharacterized protein n=1 Tax=Streptomyces europaeiscabiei TaxID=146819 RepID=A0ABU4NH09_9ACTN|nr:hypothetical protein [Streptomyces europaeiscabiei]MDX2762947.1 hypothetical protein [Streptomyces europaeiscabiei]MDX3544586.1 hypothetical protein [Streptomyces europaeiscabiei]MDX3553936.1 hypothetical protein [Streptomyces europaeiscabiei]MDX3702054.1 hypothetical protein [Streptomyces europaeiscabiei]
MTNPNAFTFGAQENSYWANRLDPAKEAERKAKKEALESEQRRMIAAHEEQQRAQAIMTHAGPALVDMIRKYDAQGRPAVTNQVERDFTEALPGATPGEFRTALEHLKASGIVHELTSSTQGFMGEKTTHLYVLEG